MTNSAAEVYFSNAQTETNVINQVPQGCTGLRIRLFLTCICGTELKQNFHHLLSLTQTQQCKDGGCTKSRPRFYPLVLCGIPVA